jgi:hypothetical protein
MTLIAPKFVQPKTHLSELRVGCIFRFDKEDPHGYLKLTGPDDTGDCWIVSLEPQNGAPEPFLIAASEEVHSFKDTYGWVNFNQVLEW